jgi:hypothetical protein
VPRGEVVERTATDSGEEESLEPTTAHL